MVFFWKQHRGLDEQTYRHMTYCVLVLTYRRANTDRLNRLTDKKKYSKDNGWYVEICITIWWDNIIVWLSIKTLHYIEQEIVFMFEISSVSQQTYGERFIILTKIVLMFELCSVSLSNIWCNFTLLLPQLVDTAKKDEMWYQGQTCVAMLNKNRWEMLNTLNTYNNKVSRSRLKVPLPPKSSVPHITDKHSSPFRGNT